MHPDYAPAETPEVPESEAPDYSHRLRGKTNPIDLLATNLAAWAEEISSQMADAIKGGLSAPGAAQLSEQQKLEYYTATLFNPDGSPNLQGRVKVEDKVGPEGLAAAVAEVLKAHPEWRQPEITDYTHPKGMGQIPMPSGAPSAWDSVVSYTPPGHAHPTYTNSNASDGLTPVTMPDQMPKEPLPPPVPGGY